MDSRNGYVLTWQTQEELAIGANIDLRVGSEGAPSSLARIWGLMYLSMMVRTDDAVEIDVLTGLTSALMTTMVTLICPVGLVVTTFYDLAPPYNTGGRLTVTGNLLRIKVRNPTGNLVTPFSLFARCWSE